MEYGAIKKSALENLSKALDGEFYYSEMMKVIYATDASVYRELPLAVAVPKHNADLEKLNVNGGAMALGHPLGGTGAKLMTTLLHELERREARYGLQAICEGGGTANAMIIERLS